MLSRSFILMITTALAAAAFFSGNPYSRIFCAGTVPPAPTLRVVPVPKDDPGPVAWAYAQQYGVEAFLDEYHNLLGSAPQAELTERNRRLAGALGLAANRTPLPARIDKHTLRHKMMPYGLVRAGRRYLARAFADPGVTPGLTEAQRLFLEWHFRAPIEYNYVLRKPGRRIVVGWDTWSELHGPADFTAYTFGQIGCTSVLALTADGSAHLSHYQGVPDTTQVYVLEDFLGRHPGGCRLYVVGSSAEVLAKVLHQRDPEIPLYVHAKPGPKTVCYTVRYERRQGVLAATFSAKPVTDDYFVSLYDWIGNPRFSEALASAIYPPTDAAFCKLGFVKFGKQDTSPVRTSEHPQVVANAG